MRNNSTRHVVTDDTEATATTTRGYITMVIVDHRGLFGVRSAPFRDGAA